MHVQDANGSAAISPRSPFDEEGGSLLSNGRVHSSDVDGAVSALLANQHSSARELLEHPSNPLHVTITFDLVTVQPDNSAGPEACQDDGKEYVRVLMHAYEAGEWTAPHANIFSSAFESRANSSTKGGESPSRVDSNNSSAMPVVSLRGTTPPASCTFLAACSHAPCHQQHSPVLNNLPVVAGVMWWAMCSGDGTRLGAHGINTSSWRGWY